MLAQRIQLCWRSSRIRINLFAAWRGRARVGGGRVDTGRESADAGVVVMQGKAQLLEVVGALNATGRFTSRLNGGQEQCDEDRETDNTGATNGRRNP